jgi:hypothetical protein
MSEREREEPLYLKQEADTKRFLETEFPKDRADDDADKVIVVAVEHHFEFLRGNSATLTDEGIFSKIDSITE